MSVELIKFATDTDLARQAASDWLAHLDALRPQFSTKTFKYAVALSGGRITKTFFGELA